MRRRKRGLVCAVVCASGALMALLMFAGVAQAEDFKQDATGGFGNANNDNALSMVEYDGRLYVGSGSLLASCEVWSYDGVTWSSLVGNTPGSLLPAGFGSPNNSFAWSMAVYGGELVVGTGNINGCEVWSYNGVLWTQLAGGLPGSPIGPGFGSATNPDAYAMAVYDGNLYVGTRNGFTGCEVWSFNGTSWTQVVGQSPPGTPGTGPGFGNAANESIESLAAFGSDLYAGTRNLNGCEVWDFNGSTWTQLVGTQPGAISGSGFGNAANISCKSLAAYAGELYAGTDNGFAGCEVWSLGVTGWTQVVGQSPPGTPGTGPGFGDAANLTAQTLIVFSGHLYAGTRYGGGGCEVWRYDGSSWVMLVGGAGATPNSAGFGNANNDTAWSAAVYDLGLYWGTLNTVSGCEVWSTKTAPTWFLAEGATAGGFETWVLVQNPNSFPVVIDIKFQTDAGEVQGPVGDLIPSESRVSYLVNAFVPGNFNVSTSVTGFGGDLICERAMYWTPQGGTYRVLGHDSIGVTTAAPTWYLAEGATGNNANGFFETWVLVQNPNPVPVDIDMDFQTSTGQVPGPRETVGASSRRSFRVNDYVNDLDVSTRVSSLTPGGNIICERAMYWTYQGSAGRRTLGHDSIGVTTPSNTWFLAEGATAGGFETWVLIQNPNPNPLPVDIKFQTAAGQVQGPVGDLIPAQSRVSYRVNDYVPNNFNVSTSVESFGGNVICERAMYWSPEGASSWELGHDSRGVTNGALIWYLAEGATLGGFETFVLVQNPNPAPVTIDIRFQTDGGPLPGPGDPPITDIVPANSRRTYKVNDFVATFDVSTRVASIAGGFIICERAMYWSAPGAERVLGHDSIGFDP
jgi:hypothetical protein